MTVRIACARIHVERVIQRLKLYGDLTRIPYQFRVYATEIFQVCAALTNFMNPLIKKVAATGENPRPSRQRSLRQPQASRFAPLLARWRHFPAGLLVTQHRSHFCHISIANQELMGAMAAMPVPSLLSHTQRWFLLAAQRSDCADDPKRD